MRKRAKQPILQFDFNQQTSIFSQPIQIIQTSKLAEIEQCLHQIEAAIEDGYYAAGYLSYEVTYAFLNRQIEPKVNSLPLLWFGIFNEPDTEIMHSNSQETYHIGPWKMKQSKTAYEETFTKIMAEIKRGNMDQVNYTVPFEASFTGNTYLYYKRLQKAQHGDYNAYLQLGNVDILSASPEMFFHLDNDEITVKPMKGTIHRGKSYQEDIANRHWLYSSKKNRLENELILDDMKAELRNITTPDSIHTPTLYEVEQYPTVYQMTSTMKGNVRRDMPITNIMKHLFPCGSITGVPKEETISFIHQIEPFPRGVYCGAIGYITPNREALFNVPIRTVTIEPNKQRATYGAGGAITVNSHVEEEYEEIMTKTKVLERVEPYFELLETIALVDGTYIVLEEHMTRLQQSASYFQFDVQMDEIRAKLVQIATQHDKGTWRVRLTVSTQGHIHTTCQPLGYIERVRVALAQKPIDSENVFHYHKTTNRELYHQHKIDDPDIFDILLWNERQELTEFTIGNLVIEIEGIFYTPPIHCGVLPGTYREHLLRIGKVQEKVMMKSELANATRIWLINSVRQWVEVYL